MHNYGGMERILISKMNILSNTTSHAVVFTTYDQDGISFPFSLSPKIDYKPIKANIAGRENLTFLRWIPAYLRTRNIFRKKLAILLKSVEPDTVICTTYSFDVLDIIIEVSRECHAKVIVESHVEASTVLMSDKYKYSHLLYPLARIWDEYILQKLKYCNSMVVLTKADAIYWEKYATISIIPNMITINPCSVIDYNSKRVISVGRYTYQKGFDMLIKAWSFVIEKHSDWKLYIFGSGDRTEYELLVNYYSLADSIYCMPATDDISSEYSKSSIYVMSSRYEGFGLVLTEAMSCGLPCISFDCPNGPSDIIQDGKDGILVTKNDIHLLAAKIEMLMSNFHLRKRLGTAAKQNVLRYNVQHIMKMWIELLEKI